MSTEIENAVDQLVEKVSDVALEEDKEIIGYSREKMIELASNETVRHWYQLGASLISLDKDYKSLVRQSTSSTYDIKLVYGDVPMSPDVFGDHDRKSITPEQVAKREKEVEKVKEKPVYKKYIENVPIKNRDRAICPRTPTKAGEASRRHWDSAIKQWKLDLYAWEKKFDAEEAEKKKTRKDEQNTSVKDTTMEDKVNKTSTKYADAVKKNMVNEGGDAKENVETVQATSTGNGNGRPTKEKCMLM